MSKRSADLADEFEKAINDFAKEVEACSDAGWSSVCNDEGWTVAQTAQHVSGQFPLEMLFITACAEGKPLPAMTWAELNDKNETRAAKNAGAKQSDVVAELRDKSATAAAYVRGLTDEQLDRTGALGLADGASVSTEQLIRGGVLIEHVTGHLGSIRKAASAAARS